MCDPLKNEINSILADMHTHTQFKCHMINFSFTYRRISKPLNSFT